MLKLSRFVLEVLPYLLTAVIAAVVVPGFLYSQVYGTKAAVSASVPTSGVNAPELVSGDHAAFALVHTLPGGFRENSRRKGGISLTARS
jgi:branched-subunit amino acid transport protein